MSYSVVNVPYRALGGGCQHDVDCPEALPYCCGGNCAASLEDPGCYPPSTGGCLNDSDCPSGVCCNGNCVDASDPSCLAPPGGCPPNATFYAPQGYCQCGMDPKTGLKLQAYPDASKWKFGCYASPPGTPTTPTPRPKQPVPSPVPSSPPAPIAVASMSSYFLPGLLIAGGLGAAALLAKRRRKA